jgi:hypothetical protein
MIIRFYTEESDLQRIEWAFWFNDGVLILDGYSFYNRPSKRHKFRLKEFYNSLYRRSSEISEEEVPLTEAIKQRAIAEFTKDIRVKKWSEFK